MKSKSVKIKIGIICGGPSLERGISLNSARTTLDHLQSDEIEVIPFYIDYAKSFYLISQSQLYSNTPSDFDFKLSTDAKKLTLSKFINHLKQVDIVFPIMHGYFGEDGKIQSLLEKNNIPFIGSSEKACKKLFDKYTANELIRKAGFFALPSKVMKIHQDDHERIINEFFAKYNLKRAIIKPARGGSSIGVFGVSSPEEALEKTRLLFSKRMDTRIVIESYATGVEFTIIVIRNKFGVPVPLIPTEIETDYTENQIFDFRRKYLPTRQVTWHCPPRFGDDVTESIQSQAQNLYSFFEMNGFARFDGWVLPDGNIWFNDFNPVSGMEQNSFLFQQFSKIGLTHKETFRYTISTALKMDFKTLTSNNNEKKKIIRIIAGGTNAERQVSLMSGTNTWLKLRNSKKYKPEFYFKDINGDLWRLPYHQCLNHTVEEITDNCINYEAEKNFVSNLVKKIRKQMMLPNEVDSNVFFEPERISMEDFLSCKDFVFIALHGGEAENGEFQKILTNNKIKFNGCDEKTSALCMNKSATSSFINSLNLENVSANQGRVFESNVLINSSISELNNIWEKLKKDFKSNTFIIKPNSDGCSSGVVRLFNKGDLYNYLQFLKEKKPFISKGVIKNQTEIVEMPTQMPDQLLLERFVETDILRIKDNNLKHWKKTGWIECTIGVLENDGNYKSMNPSITVSDGDYLTVEEKFQGGTGVNITPIPNTLIKSNIQSKIKSHIEKVSKKLNIKSYARIDVFVELKTGSIQIIEVNTLPALTPSTVIFHQALSEPIPMYPLDFIETIIESSLK